MGMDVYGNNPKENLPKEEFPVYKQYEDMEFTERWKHLDADEKLRTTYWKQMQEYEEHNVGVYFRNNCWWWRPLWSFVCNNCDFMTEEQFTAGSYNDGKEIDQETAAKIGTQLEILLADGTVDKWEEHIKKKNKELEKSEDKDMRFLSSYPFSRENVENFAKFCLESGGFIIC